MGRSSRLAVALVWLVAVIVGTPPVGAGSDSQDIEYPSWLVPGDPVDETIRYFWTLAEEGQLDAEALVDLGTLIFDRGHPDEAIEFYKQALKVDSDMYEAWFRIGLVEHTRGDLDNAEQAYSRCLKRRPGHAWCNFYYGLLEEQLGHTTKALKHYEMAFLKAPRLADPGFNPEVLSSRLALAAQVRTFDVDRFEEMMPMRLLQPERVHEVRRSFEAHESPAESPPSTQPNEPEAAAPPAAAPNAQPTPVPPAPAARTAPPVRRVPTRPPATPAPTAEGKSGETPYGAPPMAPIADTSGEALLRPGWSTLWRASERFV